ncbi:MAG: M28 family peptidase, partial [Chitinophagales bacterium]|nr:M28 family peptidase [Chitinophagales bacterium]
AMQYAETITADDLSQHLNQLAGKEFMGRGNGQDGLTKAAQYIAKYFEQFGLTPMGDEKSYFQNVPLLTTEKMDAQIAINNTNYEFLKDYYCFNRSTTNMTEQLTEVLFLGYGIDDPTYNDYKNIDVKGKTIIVLQGEPMMPDSSYILTKSKTASVWTTDWRKKTEVAKSKGVKNMLVITPDIAAKVTQYKSYILGEGMMQLAADVNNTNPTEKITNTFYINPTMAKQLLGKNYKKLTASVQKGKPKSKIIPTNLRLQVKKATKELNVANILGYIEGTDLKDELIILTAHYDHLGFDHGEVYYGADDDGSGTVALLEMAQAFAQAKAEGNGPRRSILIMPVAGEEKGLLGSRYYTDIAPVFPLKNTVADLNTDMIGRIDDQHKNGDYIYIIGDDKLSTELRRINEAMNLRYSQIDLDYRYNDENDPNRFYYRSDHYNFAKNNIPVIFYFNGTHPDYHKPTDTVDKIDFGAMEKRTRLIFHTAWELANRPDRIPVDSNKK